MSGPKLRVIRSVIKNRGVADRSRAARTGLSMHIGNKLAVKERTSKMNTADSVDDARSFP